MIAVALATLVIWLSIPTVINLASGRQLMNYSYNALDLVNTYGAWLRYELFCGRLSEPQFAASETALSDFLTKQIPGR